MKIESQVNEFEFDWAGVLVRKLNKKNSLLQGRKILIYCGEFVSLSRAIALAALYFNDQLSPDEKERQIHVSIATAKSEDKAYYEGLCQREDCTVFSLEEPKYQEGNWDYVVYGGVCNRKVNTSAEHLIDIVDDLKTFFDFIRTREIKKFILLSDYRVYGTYEDDFVFSEHEMNYKTTVENKEQMVVQVLESMVVSYAKSENIDYIILRAAIALGGGVEFNCSYFHDLFIAIAKGEKVILPTDIRKYTFIYITDLLGAIYESMIQMPMNQIYNITSDMTVSTIYDILAILKSNMDGRVDFRFEHDVNTNGRENAIDGNKFIEYGGTRFVSLEDSITINMASYGNGEKPFVFKDTYNGKIEGIREMLMLTLFEIDRICKKHNIKYFLAGGTLLGAVRHGGFIPWDDDADIMMLREDYERFVKIAPLEFSNQYFLQTVETDKNNHFFSKVRINNTVCATKFTKQFKELNNGFFVDIFPHDITANSRLGQRLHIMATVLSRSMVFNKWGSTKIKGDGNHPIIRGIATLIKNLLPISLLEKIQFGTIQFFKHKKNARFLYDGMGQNLKRGAFPIEWLEEVEYLSFEGLELPVPKQYDKYLTYLYGDYRKLIPVSDRKISHHIYMLDLGEYGLLKQSRYGNRH